MPRIIGVKFNNAGKVYYFDPGDCELRYHDHVIVETARGVEYGTVVISPTDISEDRVPGELKPVIRPATADDEERERVNREKEKEAVKICRQKIAEHGLDMKLIAAEYTFDNSKVLFYFTADGRIDFRELVKDLAGIFRTRIELRQIGVRDETKLLGGIGSCGRPLCCHTWLNEFAPVSIKMAKDQNLSLNPTKISGTCGRLMCCLKNEADTYAYLNKDLPSKGDYALAEDGRHGDVHSVNILRQTVKVIVELENDEKELQEFDVKDLSFIPKAQKHKFRETEAQELKQKKEAEQKKKTRGETEENLVAMNPDEASEHAPSEVSEAPKKSRRQRSRKKPSAGGEGSPDAAHDGVKRGNGGNSTHDGEKKNAGGSRGNDGAQNHGSEGASSQNERRHTSGSGARQRQEMRVKDSSREQPEGQDQQNAAKADAAKRHRRRRRPHRSVKGKQNASEG